MKRRYRYRVYPTESQKIALAKLFGCVRVVWNDALTFCQAAYSSGENYIGECELQKRFITQAKQTQDRQWLIDVSNIPLQQSIRDLGQAYKNFFQSCTGKRLGKKVKPPRLKRRKSTQGARFRIGGFKINQHQIYLAKLGQFKVEWSRPLPSEPSSVTIIKDAANRYFVSCVVEVNPQKLSDNGKAIGIDLGIIDFATFNNGEKVKSPKPLKKKLKRLRKLQRHLSRKLKGSKRRELARKKLAKLHAKISDTRTDFLQKLSTQVIRENQTIALEDLNVSGMVKNRKLARAISDLGWRSFRTMLEAKAAMYGRDLRIINRWVASSQICSYCGEKGGKKELNVREWNCLFCGTTHDRDINAARNILKVAGGQSETKNGRGGRRKTTPKVAVSCETSTHREYEQNRLF